MDVSIDMTPLFAALVENQARLEVILAAQTQIIAKLEDREVDEVARSIQEEVGERANRILEHYQKAFPKVFSASAADLLSRIDTE
jgi:hypothetical protein